MSPFPAYEIVVDYISEGDVANLIRGYINVNGERIRFTGVAYGRFGGQNVSPSLSRSAKGRVEEIFGDVDKFEEDLQLRLVRGDFGVKPGTAKHSHTHLGPPGGNGSAAGKNTEDDGDSSSPESSK
jgi:hypothetical protein